MKTCGIRTFATLAFSLALTACGAVNVGHNFDLGGTVARIERGVTTRDEVRVWLGAPASTGQHVASDGERLDEWAYFFAAGDLHDMRAARLKLLQIKFDAQGKVRSYNWSASPQ